MALIAASDRDEPARIAAMIAAAATLACAGVTAAPPAPSCWTLTRRYAARPVYAAVKVLTAPTVVRTTLLVTGALMYLGPEGAGSSVGLYCDLLGHRSVTWRVESGMSVRARQMNGIGMSPGCFVSAGVAGLGFQRGNEIRPI